MKVAMLVLWLGSLLVASPAFSEEGLAVLEVKQDGADAKGVRFESTVKRVDSVGPGPSVYSWKIFCASDQAVLSKISEIVYEMPGARPYKSTKAAEGFPYGKTTFEAMLVKIRVVFKDGSELKTEYQLDFSNAQP